MKRTFLLLSVAVLAGAFCAPAGAEDGFAARRKLQRDRLEAQRKLAEKARLSAVLDLNSATHDQLKTLPGIGDVYADRIIHGRPYKLTAELVYRRVITEGMYNRILDYITVKPIIR